MLSERTLCVEKEPQGVEQREGLLEDKLVTAPALAHDYQVTEQEQGSPVTALVALFDVYVHDFRH